MKQYTPDQIEILAENQIVIVGTNRLGVHGKGFALFCKQRFGLKQGHNSGLCGQCYAIVTKADYRKRRSSTLNEIGKGIQDMLLYAAQVPDKEFLVTKIGTGEAGYTVEEMRSIFVKLVRWIPENVILPIEFEVR